MSYTAPLVQRLFERGIWDIREQTCTHADLFCCGSAHGALIYSRDLSLDRKLQEGSGIAVYIYAVSNKFKCKSNIN